MRLPVTAVSAVHAVLGPAVWLACSKAQYGHMEAASGILVRLPYKFAFPQKRKGTRGIDIHPGFPLNVMKPSPGFCAGGAVPSPPRLAA